VLIILFTAYTIYLSQAATRQAQEMVAQRERELQQQYQRLMEERIRQEVEAALDKVEQRVRAGLPMMAREALAAIEARNYGDALISIRALQQALEVAQEAGAEVSVTQEALRDLVQSIQGIAPDVPEKARQVLSQIEAMAPKT
jgi:LPS O-antigen subunit length determinant protein (WzzB/FepE family)